jgi:hypothetical protein
LSEESLDDSDSESELEADVELGDAGAFFLGAASLVAFAFLTTFCSASDSESLLESLLVSLSELLLELPLELLLEELLEPLLELELELLLELLLESLSESPLALSSVSTSIDSAVSRELGPAALLSHVENKSSRSGWACAVLSMEISRFFVSTSSLRAESEKPLFWRKSRTLAKRAAGGSGCFGTALGFFSVFCFFSRNPRCFILFSLAILLNLTCTVSLVVQLSCAVERLVGR